MQAKKIVLATTDGKWFFKYDEYGPVSTIHILDASQWESLEEAEVWMSVFNPNFDEKEWEFIEVEITVEVVKKIKKWA